MTYESFLPLLQDGIPAQISQIPQTSLPEHEDDLEVDLDPLRLQEPLVHQGHPDQGLNLGLGHHQLAVGEEQDLKADGRITETRSTGVNALSSLPGSRPERSS